MHALFEPVHLIRVTDRTIHSGPRSFAGSLEGRCHIRVALRTAGVGMGRSQIVDLIDKEGQRLTIAKRSQLGIRMAGQAVLIGQALGVEDVANLVGRMAVDTGGDLVGFLLPQPALDEFPVNLFDLTVALGAGLGDVVMMNR